MLPEYLKEHSFDLKSVTDTDFSDLQPLKEILRGVKVVALGESTHGTKEFFRLKHRLVRFLAEEMGFRTFVLEAGMIPCMNIDAFVSKENGDRAKALASQGYWTWDTKEVSDMLDWMREHNARCAPEDEIRFAGMDVKPVPEAIEFLRKIVPCFRMGDDARAAEVLDGILSLDDTRKGDPAACLRDATWLLGALAFNELPVLAAHGKAAYDKAEACARTLCQYVDSMHLTESLQTRDEYMADNLLRLLDTLPPDEKVIVWAHNYHVSSFGSEGVPCTGSILRERLGDRYYCFALTFGKGGFQSRLIDVKEEEFGDLQEFVIPGPRKGYWEEELAARGGSWYCDLRSACRDDAGTKEWAKGKKPLFGAGGGFIPFPEDGSEPEEEFPGYELETGFDGLLFIEETHRAEPTPTGERKKGQRSR